MKKLTRNFQSITENGPRGANGESSADTSQQAAVPTSRSGNMSQPFHIFRIAKGGELHWLEATETLEAAASRVNTLRESSHCDYMILSHRTGKRMLFTASGGITTGAFGFARDETSGHP